MDSKPFRNRVIIAYVLVLGWSAFQAAAQSQPTNAIAALLALVEKGDYATTIEQSSAAISTNRNCPELFYIRAIAHRMKGDLKLCLNDFGSALRASPNTAIPAGSLPRAIFAYTQALRLQPNNVGLLTDLAAARTINGDYEAAIEDCNKAISINSNHVAGFYNRGRAYMKRMEYDRAIPDFRAALKVDPKLAEAYEQLGVAYAKKSDFTNALENYDRLISARPRSGQAFYGRGLVYSELGDKPRSEQDFKSAKELGFQEK